MSNALSTLRDGVATLTEAFTEVEDELDSGVYAAMHPALKQVQDNLASAAVNLENFGQVQRILEAMSKSDGSIPVHFVDAIIGNLPEREVEEAPRPARRPRERAVPREVQPRAIPQMDRGIRINTMPDPFQRAFAEATAWPTMPEPRTAAQILEAFNERQREQQEGM